MTSEAQETKLEIDDDDVIEEEIKVRNEVSKEMELRNQTFRIITVVVFYFFVSISLVFLNKNIMLEDFEFPIFITWCQLVIALLCVVIFGELGKSWKPASIFPPFELDTNVAKQVLPLTLVYVGMISFNNLCLLYVEVTFYQVVRSLTVVFTIIFTYSILGQETSSNAIKASMVVVLGFALGSLGEVHFTWLGIIFGVSSSAFVSLYSIYVKKVMIAVGGDQWKLLLYNTTLAIFLMIPIIFISGEFPGLKESLPLQKSGTWINIFITGLFGFLINIAVFLQIKFTSPLTNNISGTLKACIQTLLAMLIYRNPVTFTNAIGISLVIFGSFLYSNIRYNEMRQKSSFASPKETV